MGILTALFAHLGGIEALVLRLLYGTGMRLMEGVRLRIKDVDFVRNEILVRDGKGGEGSGDDAAAVARGTAARSAEPASGHAMRMLPRTSAPNPCRAEARPTKTVAAMARSFTTGRRQSAAGGVHEAHDLRFGVQVEMVALGLQVHRLHDRRAQRRRRSPGRARITARRSAECSLPRHSSRRPSTVRRTRLHRWQKLWLCGEMKPTRVALSAMRQ